MKLRNKKTGEIKTIEEIIREAFINNELETLKRIDDNWEDYNPKEPLIKDEKIRKLVKEWATLFEEHRKIKYYEYNDFVAFRLCREKGTPDPELDISIDYELVNLREGYEYDFEELCGEEKECES